VVITGPSPPFRQDSLSVPFLKVPVTRGTYRSESHLNEQTLGGKAENKNEGKPKYVALLQRGW